MRYLGQYCQYICKRRPLVGLMGKKYEKIILVHTSQTSVFSSLFPLFILLIPVIVKTGLFGTRFRAVDGKRTMLVENGPALA